MGLPACDFLADTIRSLLTLMKRLGAASAAAAQVDTLAARLEEEIRARRRRCQRSKEMMALVLSGHVGVHLGQLSSWRRMIGLPPQV